MNDARIAHAELHAGSSPPAKWMLFLHGVFGSGANWRTFAKKFVEARPAWGACLVDLRMHGASQGFGPPHDLASVARDLAEVEAALPGPVRGMVGHSFGGKVTLERVRQREGDLEVAFVLDATPSARPTQRGSETIVTVLEALRGVPERLASREDFLARLEAAGVPKDLGPWLAMNVRPDAEGYRLRLQVPAIDAMLADYWARDLWHVVESPPGEVTLHLVLGGTSRVFDEEDRARAERAQANGRVRLHVIEGAGHWVHVDAPVALLDILVRAT